MFIIFICYAFPRPTNSNQSQCTHRRKRIRDPDNRISQPTSINVKARKENTTGEWKRFRSTKYAHKQLFPNDEVRSTPITRAIERKTSYKEYIFEYDHEDLPKEEVIPIEDER